MKELQCKETFLIRYFIIDAIIGQYITNKRDVFDKLANVYCINDKEKLDALFELCNNEDVSAVPDKETYERTMRVLEYVKLVGRKSEIAESVLFVLNCKGIAYTKTKEIQQFIGANSGKTRMLQTLTKLLDAQEVLAYGIMSFLLFEGYIVPKDKEKAKVLAEKSAKWNDIYSLLLLIKYDKTNVEKYLCALSTILSSGVLIEEYKEIFAQHSNKDIGTSKEAALVYKYQCQMQSEKDKINGQVIRIAYSERLSYESKKRILLSGSKEFISSINELPIGNSNEPELLPQSPLVFSTLKRKEESQIVEWNLLRHQKNRFQSKPLLLEIAETFICDEYTEAISKSYSKYLVEHISAAHMTRVDFIPTKDNFVLRSLMNNNRASGVFIIKGIEELSEEYVQELCKFFEPLSRRNYKLQEPSITLNFSNNLFVLMTSNIHAVDGRIKNLCQVVEIEELSKEEKILAIINFVKTSGDLYDLPNIEISESAIKYLSTYSYSECEDILEEAFKNRNYSGNDSNILSVSELESASKKTSTSSMGFRIMGGVR